MMSLQIQRFIAGKTDGELLDMLVLFLTLGGEDSLLKYLESASSEVPSIDIIQAICEHIITRQKRLEETRQFWIDKGVLVVS